MKLSIAMVALALAMAAGCESVIPRRDLQIMARTLPPSPDLSIEQRGAMIEEIRQRTGVTTFEPSNSSFEPEMRLPPGTGWILGMFIGGEAGEQ